MSKMFAALGLFFFFFLLAGRGLPEASSEVLRSIENINHDWLYLEDCNFDIDDLNNQTNWKQINLPHTWNQWDATDFVPGYRRDKGWYKKQLSVSSSPESCHILYFEGVNIVAEVFVNKQLAGTHSGGYVGFEVDITEYLTKGGINELIVSVDNGYNPNIIPSQKSDFFIYGGITRDVWLKTVPDTYIQRATITTPNVNSESASTQVKAYLANPGNNSNEGLIRVEVYGENNTQAILTQEKIIRLDQNQFEAVLDLPMIQNPKLWSPDHPFLYTMNIVLEVNGHKTDELEERYGYRWYKFEKNGPFYLNGKKIKIRGTHRHEEHAGKGAAMTNEEHRRDMEMIKDMGANFVRLGHYPQDPEVYKVCDELGIIVWDELPWCRGGKGQTLWESNTKRLLREQIIQNYNHPSIFFWSLGNEIYWLPDFEGGGDEDKLNKFLTELNELAHQLDPYRLTGIRKYPEGAHLVDVYSPSIWSGWYRGIYKNYEKALQESREKYERFVHMEYGGSSHVGRHTETPINGDGLVNKDDWSEEINQINVTNIAKTGDWTENYIVDLFDWHLSVSESRDWFSGNAQWAFKDFGTPLRPENPIPFINQKGLVDRNGKPKDAYYVFKSYWSRSPFVYIESKTWTERNGPEGKSRNISVFSNCSVVELYQDGKSLGRKNREIGKFPASGLNWDVLFNQGVNGLIAIGYENEQIISRDTLEVFYSFEKSGSPEKIALSAHPLPNGNYLIEAIAVDSRGRRVLSFEDRVYFSEDGSSELLIDYGTPTRSQVIEMANGRAAIELKPSPGKTIIEARNQDFKGSYLELVF